MEYEIDVGKIYFAYLTLINQIFVINLSHFSV